MLRYVLRNTRTVTPVCVTLYERKSHIIALYHSKSPRIFEHLVKHCPLITSAANYFTPFAAPAAPHAELAAGTSASPADTPRAATALTETRYFFNVGFRLLGFELLAEAESAV